MEKDEERHLPSNQVCNNPPLCSSSFNWKQAVWELLNYLWQQHGRKTPNGNTFGTFQEQPVMRCEKIFSTWWSNSAAGFVTLIRHAALLLAVVAKRGLRELQFWPASLSSKEIAHPCSNCSPPRFTVHHQWVKIGSEHVREQLNMFARRKTLKEKAVEGKKSEFQLQRDSSLNVSPDRQFISAAANANRLALVSIWNSLSRWID